MRETIIILEFISRRLKLILRCIISLSRARCGSLLLLTSFFLTILFFFSLFLFSPFRQRDRGQTLRLGIKRFLRFLSREKFTYSLARLVFISSGCPIIPSATHRNGRIDSTEYKFPELTRSVGTFFPLPLTARGKPTVSNKPPDGSQERALAAE